MQFRRIALTHFKSYAQSEFLIRSKFVGIVGPNGVGKTNLLDAIALLCLGKSYFQSTDKQCVAEGAPFFRVECILDSDHDSSLAITYQLRAGKTIFWHNKALDRISDHVGRLPVVVVAPDDMFELLKGSEQRRRFLDVTICQYHSNYLQDLIQYNRLLQQRNTYLKRSAEGYPLDAVYVRTLSQRMAPLAASIFKARREFMVGFEEQLQEKYRQISGPNESVSISYKSSLSTDNLVSLHEQHWDKDTKLLRTTAGIHRDDLRMKINGRSVKAYASQGQKKTFLFALKIGQYQWLAQKSGKSPILLLDDLFEKLDEDRMTSLMQMVDRSNFGQVFLTDTHKERVEEMLHFVSADSQIIEINTNIMKEQEE